MTNTLAVFPRVATRPTWVEVSISRLRQNFRTLQEYVGADVTICAVVKADAYGHGSIECSSALEAEGARWLGLTSLDEAVPLREAGIKTRILGMTGFWQGEESELIRWRLTPTVWEPWQIEALEKVASRMGARPHPVHLKVDTGMGRLGAALERLPAILTLLKSTPHLILEGVSTHLASSNALDASSGSEQENRFADALRMIRSAGFDPPFIHLANTGAVISRRETWKTMVRPGLSLYGYHLPCLRAGREVSDSTQWLPLEPVLTWKTEILSLRDFTADQPLGYGGTYVTRAPAKVAVLPVGYADGYNRQLSNRGRVIVRGHYAPVVGSVSMDLTLVDVTGIPGIAMGDEVILMGSCDGLSVDAFDHAQLIGGLPYEVLCSISKRVPRRYL